MKSLPPVSPTRRGYDWYFAMFCADRLPHALEDLGAAGEVNAREIRRGQQRVGDHAGAARQEVDDARRHARRLEHAHHVVRAQHRARRRLPDRHAAHQHGRRREVAADRREVERRHRVDEAFERPVLELVPDAGAVDRLLGVELLRVADVEAPEVDELAGGVDLRLEHRLRLAQHRRRVDASARQVVASSSAALSRTAARSSNGHADHSRRAASAALIAMLDVLRLGHVPVGEHVLVLERHHGLLRLAGADFLAADDERNLDALVGHRGQARLELSALGRSRRVGLDGLVEGRGNGVNAAGRGDGRGRRSARARSSESMQGS